MRILVANRGEIACRLIAGIRELGHEAVAVFTDVDSDAPHVKLADHAIGLGEPRAYLDIAKLIAAMKASGAKAVHPGYGFVSQSAEFVEACDRAGVIFIGPSAKAMRALGDKRGSRQLAEGAQVPVVPGDKSIEDPAAAELIAARIGYPVLLKASGGGGGKGMRRVDDAKQVAEAFAAAQREAKAAFGDDRMQIEKYVHPARHVEVQILGDGKRAIALGDRECSLQRRYQKIIEEGPSAAISDETRKALHAAAVRLAEAAGYASAGTVEFIVGPDGGFYFLEVNTRLQVEHPVTELITGFDIVRAQIELALGGSLPAGPPPSRGHAIEARLNAEDPYHGFLPQTGKLLVVEWPRLPGVRVDAGVATGSEVTPAYDSLLAKIIAHGSTREEARGRLLAALRATTVLGVVTNQVFLAQLLESEAFVTAQTFTTTVENATWAEPPVPVYVEELANAAAVTVRKSVATGADVYSPWQRLGAFRMSTGT